MLVSVCASTWMWAERGREGDVEMCEVCESKDIVEEVEEFLSGPIFNVENYSHLVIFR